MNRLFIQSKILFLNAVSKLWLHGGKLSISAKKKNNVCNIKIIEPFNNTVAIAYYYSNDMTGFSMHITSLLHKLFFFLMNLFLILTMKISLVLL